MTEAGRKESTKKRPKEKEKVQGGRKASTAILVHLRNREKASAAGTQSMKNTRGCDMGSERKTGGKSVGTLM